ncbi:MAG: glycosyltransferase, partial [Alphaproteobacteria bacterium]|nr:glycosyltransferase [Alphaproteobacteria bacterium]
MFKKDLFEKNNLRFENYIRCNDLTCIYTALSASDKISITNKSLINYRSNQTNNASAKRANHIDCFLYAANKLEKNLKQLNLYDKFEKTFLAKIQECFAWEISVCTEEQKEKVKSDAKRILSKKLYDTLYAPLVSVIVPVYNVAKYLPDCLESLINQTLKNIEIVCINDGSTDNSLDILQKYTK